MVSPADEPGSRRAGQHRRLSNPAKLRPAALRGVALALFWLVANDLGSAVTFWAHTHPALRPRARPAVAIAGYLAPNYLIFPLLGHAGSGVAPVAAWQWYLPLAGVAVLGTCVL